ncbi:MAG: tetraacyldisaccharide 4'-kinase [Candidatus Omnitrophica bacterium]|nr:tetraacyldisaccharide 4'-kinase [Candidatus Omnitrophota bacterium]
MRRVKSYIVSIMKDERKTADARVAGVFLSIVSYAYFALLQLMYFLRKIKILPRHKVRPKVISVGNITLGGTGKTPFTIFLARHVQFMGRKVTVLHRGYGNDESVLLKEKLAGIPVIIGRDRVKNALQAYDEFKSDCVVLDDGFQHHRICRDLDILLIDSTNPFGNMKIFPRGILREPLARLRDAHVAILTKSDMGGGNIEAIEKEIHRYNKDLDIAQSYYEPVDLQRLFSKETIPLSYLKDRRLSLVSGIANPDYFSWIVERLGATVVDKFCYEDHYGFEESDVSTICNAARKRGVRLIITTEKDAVRLRRFQTAFGELDLAALRVEFRVRKDEKKILGRLHSICNS